MQLLANQPSFSIIKKKGPGSKGEFARMNLAVYPFQVQFLSNVEYKTFFSFQKNYQIIGEINKVIPSCEKGSKYQLQDINNIIYFKLYSTTNVVYKWSVYRRYVNGEEEYLQSCTLNLKEIVNNYLLPQKDFASHTNNSLIALGFHAKQMRLKFPKTGIILMFMLFVSDDLHQIKEYVENKIIRKQYDHVLENIPPLGLLKADSNSGLVALSSKKNQNSNYSLEDMERNKSHKKTSHESLLPDSKLKENLINTFSDPKKDNLDSSDQIANLIESFEPNSGENPGLNQDFNENRLEKQLKQQLKAQMFQQNTAKQQNVEGEKKNENRDYGMLKLESDQGGVNQDPIDKKLQLEELQAIEQERTSKGYQSQTLTPLKPRKTNQKIFYQATNQIKEQSEVSESKFNVKKIVIVVAVSFFLFLIAVTLGKNIAKKKSKKRLRR